MRDQMPQTALGRRLQHRGARGAAPMSDAAAGQLCEACRVLSGASGLASRRLMRRPALLH